MSFSMKLAFLSNMLPQRLPPASTRPITHSPDGPSSNNPVHSSPTHIQIIPATDFPSPMYSPTSPTFSTDQPNPPSIHPMTTRTRDNTRRLRTFPDHIALSITFLQANSHPEWRQAMATEMNALALNKTWILIPPPPGHNSIGYK
jgi:hypothetical protein